MKDISIQVRLHNNRLRERRQAAGLTQQQLGKAAGVSNCMVSRLEALRLSPLTASWLMEGEPQWKPAARRLARYFNVAPEELFPVSLSLVSQPVIEAKVDVVDLLVALPNAAEHMALPADQQMEELEIGKELGLALSRLTERERRVISSRFGLDGQEHAGAQGMTLEEIGAECGVSRERVGQIETKAMRKLRANETLRYLTDGEK